jgi:hypothetical protein
MGRTQPGDYASSWTAPEYTVDDRGKVVGGYTPREPNNWAGGGTTISAGRRT